MDQKKKTKLVILGSSLLMIFGIVAISISYLKEKRAQAFEMMNLKILEKENGSNREEKPGQETEETLDQLPTIDNLQEEQENKSEATATSYIGTLEIPKINLTKGLVAIDSPYNNIEHHVTIHASSSYPNVEGGNFILMAHSGTAAISFFRNLYQLTLQDVAYVTYQGIKYQYEIVNIYRVPKNGSVSIHRKSNKQTLTLITCSYEDDTRQTVYIAELIGQEIM